MNNINQHITDRNCLKNSLLTSQNVASNHILAKNCFITPKNEFCNDKQYLRGQNRGSKVMGSTSRTLGPGLGVLDWIHLTKFASLKAIIRLRNLWFVFHVSCNNATDSRKWQSPHLPPNPHMKSLKKVQL